MAEIHQFPSNHNNTPSSAVSHTARRADALRAARDAKKEFIADDQLLVAQNLHVLLEELQKEQCVKKLEVVRLASLGGEGTDSTKQLYTYTLNRPLFAGDPEVRILGYGKEQMWKQIFT